MSTKELAAELFKAGQREKRKQGKAIWGVGIASTLDECPTETYEVWLAVAKAAQRIFHAESKRK